MCSYLRLNCGCSFAHGLSRRRAAFPDMAPSYYRLVTCAFAAPAPAATGPSASCKLLGFGCACHAICTECLANKTHPKTLDIHNLLNGNVSYRSEEHTSELQSLRHLVCRLLL